jgi:hypothetical protein
MHSDSPPTLDDIEARFEALLDGRETRDAVDRWATRWYADDRLTWDDLSSWALDLLCGIDLQSGPNEDLHDEAQISAWLEELRRRRAV